MAKYARTEVALILILGTVATWVTAAYAGWWALLPGLLALALLSFYRDPPRRIPKDPLVLVSPADGKVTDITRERARTDGGGAEWCIGIFLSVANVHVNRSPCTGRVVDVRYVRGKFINALNPDCARVNESNTIVLDPQPPVPGPVGVRQVSGALARRIVCEAEPGDEMAAGQRFGMIKLGSRTELIAPEDPRWEMVVRVGDWVKGGATVLARLNLSPHSGE